MKTHASTRSQERAQARAGLTLIELMIAMVVGLVVISTATAYVKTTDRNITGATAREDYNRKARFLGLALRRDIGEAGVMFTSNVGFGSVAVFGDTITILKVPFDNPTVNPVQDPAYNVVIGPISPPGATGSTNSSNNCGNSCVRLRRQAPGQALTLVSGMVAALTQTTTRRLIVINAVTYPVGASDSVQVTFRSSLGLLHRPSVLQTAVAAGAASGVLTGITNANTTVQRLDLVAYWRDAQNNLWRATRMDPATGNFVGEVVATGCTAFTARLVFQDGTTSAVGGADSTTATHAFNNINGVIITTTLVSDLVDSRINGGVALGRTYTFRVTPRNLLYERNRGA